MNCAQQRVSIARAITPGQQLDTLQLTHVILLRNILHRRPPDGMVDYPLPEGKPRPAATPENWNRKTGYYEYAHAKLHELS